MSAIEDLDFSTPEIDYLENRLAVREMEEAVGSDELLLLFASISGVREVSE